MMTNKEQLEKEGLLITEFSDDWFERETNDFEVDEIEKDIKSGAYNPFKEIYKSGMIYFRR